MSTAAGENTRFQTLDALGRTLVGVRHEYGTHPDQFVELHGDPHTARSVVVFIHGGYFRERTDLAHARPFASAIAEAGALCVLVEYRRAGGAPHSLEDVTAAIGFTFESLEEWGVGTLARKQPTVAGHSAGGCLALGWASHLGESGPSIRLRPLAPITDLFREVELGLADGAVLDYLGVRPQDDLAAYIREDPRTRAVLIPERVDVLSVHGDADATVSIEFSRTFPAPFQEIRGANHSDLVDPESPVAAEVLALLVPTD